jgi:hypothetical protein
VKFNSSKRKRGPSVDARHARSPKRKKPPLPAETTVPSSISAVTLKEFNHSLPRLKTTQQLLMQMQMNEPHLLATQTSTANAILQRKIIDEGLQETIKLNYAALHHGREPNHSDDQ